MPLAAGTRLGPYEIVAAIGAGGMGEVYKARDTRLDRIIAIKVLPPEWVDHAEMKERFDREAQTIASLNHPHICALHDVGTASSVSYLVMEFLDGETLAERLKRGALPLDEALAVAIAIADALDKAHRQGVVHRDLKPGNIMLTETGAKLLDFGLARLMPQAGITAVRPASDRSPGRATPVTPLTATGAILGTLQYMAPEQLDGHEADARTDIFAFGTVLHEMVTGRKAFEGKSQVLLISAIATAEPPPLSAIQPAASPALMHVVTTCLAKDPDDRWQSARDLLAELEWIAEGGADTGLVRPDRGSAPHPRGRLIPWMLAAAAVVVLALAAPAALYLRGPAEPDMLEVRMPINPLIFSGNPANNGFFAVSPDGRQIVIRARSGLTDPNSLYVGAVGFLSSQRLPGTEDTPLVNQPFWSPDSRSIAFFHSGKLKKVPASGGPPQPICDAPDFFGGTWNRNGTIVFGTSRGLFRVPAEGGQPAALTTLEGSETGHFWPRFLPDGRHILYLAWSAEASNRAVYVGTLDSKERTRIMAAESNIAYVNPGFLLFQRESSLYAQPFSATTLALTGEPSRLAAGVPYNPTNGRSGFDASDDGVLAYFRDSNATSGALGDAREWQLAWVGRDGQNPQTVGKAGVYRGAEVSPDGTRVAVHRHDPKGGDIWVLEPRDTETRITFDASHDNSSPIWSHDGKRIAYASQRNGKWGLYQSASDGSGMEALLLESELPKVPVAWSPDGQRLIYQVRDPKTGDDLWMLPFDGDKKAVPLIATPANETHAQVSPDGKWIAYASNLTDRNEIYVQPFPSGSGRWQVSPDVNAGGDWPRWTRDGKELLYHSLGSGLGTGTTTPTGLSAFTGPLFSVVWRATGSTFQHERPKEVLRVYALHIAHAGGDYHTYAVSPNGQRFLIFQQVLTTSSGTGDEIAPDPSNGLTILMHWMGTVKK